MRSVPMFLYPITLIFTSLLITGCKPNTPAAPTMNPIAEVAVTTKPVNPDTCLLKVGFDAWEPYHYLGQAAQPQGLDIDILQALTRELNCELQLVPGDWANLLSQLQAGELDVLPGASKNAERESYAWFSDAYRQEQFVLLTRTEMEMDYADFPAFIEAGHTIGVVSGYYYGDLINQLYGEKPQAFVNAQISELNLARLQDEEISGALEDSFVAAAIIRRKGLSQQIQRHSLSLAPSEVYFMLSKKSISESQLAEFNQAISALQQNGSLAELISRYQQ